MRSNLYFKMLENTSGGLTRKFQEEFIEQNKSTIYILGQLINRLDLFKECTEQCMVYLSYRRFTEPLKAKGETANSDTRRKV